MTVEVYKWVSDTEEYTLAARLNDDGTVEGDSSMSLRLSFVVDFITESGEDPADYHDEIRKRLHANWVNGFYRVTWD
ncbi:hypothetical protein [Halomonas sp.]|uniref:hypothetical protein n=1 Tax=Halomonas sp. TaxID=1486246 RepID=UPI00356A0C0B